MGFGASITSRAALYLPAKPLRSFCLFLSAHVMIDAGFGLPANHSNHTNKTNQRFEIAGNNSKIGFLTAIRFASIRVIRRQHIAFLLSVWSGR